MPVQLLELLAPARTADIGIEAVRHGADAVYIGATSFGARQAAGNSVEDIRRLVDYAHLFGAKVYATVNTIIYEQELDAVRQLACELHDIGTDALIVQDMALTRMNLPVPLHASTQMDNRTPEKVRELSMKGFQQVVLARELSLEQIWEIHEMNPSVRLEAFVHGALCVSYSGRCYVSQMLFGRSANRGECAQVCRMGFDLENERGDKLMRDKHLLSLKDMCRIGDLEAMADAGVSSFKIEGRLKDMAYVKNVTAAYSQVLDALVEKFPKRYRRASRGEVRHAFTPDVRKSFNRGFTSYLLHGSADNIAAIDTPKAIGMEVGRIEGVFHDCIVVRTNARDVEFHNGDGLCCLDAGGRLIGFRVNRAEGNRLYLLHVNPTLRKGMKVYRNFDKQFEEVLAGQSAERFIPVDMVLDFDKSASSFSVCITDGQQTIVRHYPYVPELARTPQRENIYRQFARLGNTPLRLENLHINYQDNFFIPSSVLAAWRRQTTDAFLSASREDGSENKTQALAVDAVRYNALEPINVANSLSEDFYTEIGMEAVPPAFELNPNKETALMTCRHCVKRTLGWCAKSGREPHGNIRMPGAYDNTPLYLVLANGKRLRLRFDCKNCEMIVTNP